MNTVSYRQFVNGARLRRSVFAGKGLLVLHHGRPYFRALPPEKPATSEGAARRLSSSRGVSPEPVAETWGGLA